MGQSAVEFITEAFAEALTYTLISKSIISELLFHGTFIANRQLYF